MPTLSPPTTPYYGGGQVLNPANVKKTSGAPSTKLTDDHLGTLAIDNAAAIGYLLVSKSGGVDTWARLEAGGAGGSFTTLTSTGATTLATTGASTNTFGNTTGATSVGILAGSGGINLTGNVLSLNPITITVGNVTLLAGNFVASNPGSGIVLNSGTASGTTTATLNGRSGQVTITTPSIAAGATFSFALTNSSVTASTTQILYGLTGGTTGSAITIQSVTNSANTSTIVVQNASAVTNSTGSLVLTFLVLN